MSNLHRIQMEMWTILPVLHSKARTSLASKDSSVAANSAAQGNIIVCLDRASTDFVASSSQSRASNALCYKSICSGEQIRQYNVSC